MLIAAAKGHLSLLLKDIDQLFLLIFSSSVMAVFNEVLV